MTVTMIKRIDILRTLQRNYKAAKERNSDELCSQLAHTEELFRTKVNEDCLRIEVNTQELGKLLPDYIRMLSEKSPLAAVALLGKGLPIDTMDVIGRIKYYCEYFFTVAHDELPERATFFVASFSETRGQEYDMDAFLSIL